MSDIPPTPRQAAIYGALEDVVEVFGQFDQTTGPDGAHYVEQSPFPGMVCASCYFYEGPRACEIVAGDIAPEAICKWWLIPAELLAGAEQGMRLHHELLNRRISPA
jgi:hypothetical protein